ncbi:MFS transporter [Streptomyces axinellae]|uniref:Major facilitator superfamily (MFS) profile domain-containing protein n=1 Tax=Streptomyces axinellae TaxID=552788 RepID=A0ABP6CIA0_9ACTN
MKPSLSTRRYLPAEGRGRLAALTLAAFAVQTDDYLIVGVLPAVSETVGRSGTATGQLVTAYSLTYALFAPVWALLPFHLRRATALRGALIVFTAANFAMPLVNSYAALMVLRVTAALAAAVVLPTALADAGAAAPPDHRGRYLAAVMTGVTGAVLLGIPGGTWIGAAFGWRASFVFGGLLGLGSLLLLARFLPAEPHATSPRATLRETVRPLLSGTVSAILAATALTVAGNLAFQTYLAPFLAGLSGAGPAALAALLVCSGAGGLVGTQVSGRLCDRYAPGRVFLLASAVFCAVMLAFAGLWALRPVPVAVAAGVLVIWSAAAWAVPPSIQSLLLARAGAGAAAQTMAVNSSAVYTGAALGGAAGGAALAADLGLVPLVAAAPVLLGALVTAPVLRARANAVPNGHPQAAATAPRPAAAAEPAGAGRGKPDPRRRGRRRPARIRPDASGPPGSLVRAGRRPRSQPMTLAGAGGAGARNNGGMFRDSVPEGAPRRPYPVTDATGYLLGRWNIERTVYDLRARVEGGFRGVADFRTEAGPADAGPEACRGPVLHVEEGELTWEGRTYAASRSLRVRARADGTADVEFTDGRPFHDLDLRTGRWLAVHPCAADRYEGTFLARSADEWHLEWRISGPAKDQLLRSVYRRRADRARR